MVKSFSARERQDHSIGEEESFQQMVLRQLDIYMQENEFGQQPHTISKN